MRRRHCTWCQRELRFDQLKLCRQCGRALTLNQPSPPVGLGSRAGQRPEPHPLRNVNPMGGAFVAGGSTLAVLGAVDGTWVGVFYGLGLAAMPTVTQLMDTRARNQRADRAVRDAQGALDAQHAALARRADEAHQFWYYCDELVPTLDDAQRAQLVAARTPSAQLSIAEIADGSPQLSFLPTVPTRDRHAVVRTVYGDDCPEDLLAPLWCALSERVLAYRDKQRSAAARRRATAETTAVDVRLRKENAVLRAANDELRAELEQAYLTAQAHGSAAYKLGGYYDDWGNEVTVWGESRPAIRTGRDPVITRKARR